MGDGFGSRWDTEGGTASFTSSWALEKEEPKEEVTISSIQPIGERYLLRFDAHISLLGPKMALGLLIMHDV